MSDEDMDVAALRQRVGLSQPAFARAIGVSVGTLRGWEQGRRVPPGAARALLRMISEDPSVACFPDWVGRRVKMTMQLEMLATAARNLARITAHPQPTENPAEAKEMLEQALPLLRSHPELAGVVEEVEAAIAEAVQRPVLVGVVELSTSPPLFVVVPVQDLMITWHAPTAKVEITDPRLTPPIEPVPKSKIRQAFGNQLDKSRLPPNHYLGRVTM